MKARSLDTAEETNWGFGQVLPMVLLAAPAFSMGEFIYGQLSSFSPSAPLKKFVTSDTKSYKETRSKQSTLHPQSRPLTPVVTTTTTAAAASTSSNEDIFQVNFHNQAWFSGVIGLGFTFIISFASIFLLLFAAFPFEDASINNDGVLQTHYPYSIGTNGLTASLPNDFKSFLRFSAASVGIVYFYIIICLLLHDESGSWRNGSGVATSRVAIVIKRRSVKAIFLLIFLFVCAGAIAASSWGIAYRGVMEPLNAPIGTLVSNGNSGL